MAYTDESVKSAILAGIWTAYYHPELIDPKMFEKELSND
jgi:hypothetical protein